MAVTTLYEVSEAGYNRQMTDRFTVGDVIRKARKAKHWNQHRLGKEAQLFVIRSSDGKINKSTVSKVERDPYSSEFGTVWRLAAALRLTLGQLERQVPAPFFSKELVGVSSMATEAEAEAKKTERVAVLGKRTRKS